MRAFKIALLFSVLLAGAQGVRAGEIQVWAMAASGNGHLYRIDEPSDTLHFIGSIKDPTVGDVGSGWSTDAISPTGTLYFLRRDQVSDHVFSLDSHNIAVSGGIITNLKDLGPSGLGGNLDGLTAGPDGKLYIAAYQNTLGGPVNGLYRFDPNSLALTFVGTFAGNGGPSGANSFYTDLAFDPITKDLIGTGFDSTGAFIPYRLNGNLVQTGSNLTFNYVDAFTGWNGLSDGLAFNFKTGDLYASSDTGGVYQIDRTTGAIIRVLAQSDTLFGGEVGTDLAVLPFDAGAAVPEPSSLALLTLGGIALAGWRRWRNRKQVT